jgi:hypothetical protein
MTVFESVTCYMCKDKLSNCCHGRQKGEIFSSSTLRSLKEALSAEKHRQSAEDLGTGGSLGATISCNAVEGIDAHFRLQV